MRNQFGENCNQSVFLVTFLIFIPGCRWWQKIKSCSLRSSTQSVPFERCVQSSVHLRGASTNSFYLLFIFRSQLVQVFSFDRFDGHSFFLFWIFFFLALLNIVLFVVVLQIVWFIFVFWLICWLFGWLAGLNETGNNGECVEVRLICLSWGETQWMFHPFLLFSAENKIKNKIISFHTRPPVVWVDSMWRNPAGISVKMGKLKSEGS